jgi:hypothetical protein
VARAIRGLKAKKAEVRWSLPEVLASIGTSTSEATPESAIAASVDDAVRVRIRAERRRALATLRALGVRADVIALAPRSAHAARGT